MCRLPFTRKSSSQEIYRVGFSWSVSLTQDLKGGKDLYLFAASNKYPPTSSLCTSMFVIQRSCSKREPFLGLDPSRKNNWGPHQTETGQRVLLASGNPRPPVVAGQLQEQQPAQAVPRHVDPKRGPRRQRCRAKVRLYSTCSSRIFMFGNMAGLCRTKNRRSDRTRYPSANRIVGTGP